jgi:hypothetical protein
VLPNAAAFAAAFWFLEKIRNFFVVELLKKSCGIQIDCVLR